MSFTLSGASLANALAILRVKLSLRRLPTITTTLYGLAMGFPFDGMPGGCLAVSLANSINDASAWIAEIRLACGRKPWSARTEATLDGPTLSALVRIAQVLFAGG